MMEKRKATVVISSREKVFVEGLRFVIGSALITTYSPNAVKLGKRIQTNSKGNKQLYETKIGVEYSVEVDDP